MMKKLLKKFVIGSLIMSITFSSAMPVFATETTDNNTTDDGTNNSTDNNTDNSTDNTDGSTANGTESTTTSSSSNLQGADKIINTYIQMAKGSTVADEDVNALTEAELRFLGIYVSNFYVPFGTELGSAGNDDDNTTQNKEDIKKTLQTQLKFSDDLADQLTEKILSLARGTAVELSFAFSKEYQSGYKEELLLTIITSQDVWQEELIVYLDLILQKLRVVILKIMIMQPMLKKKISHW